MTPRLARSSSVATASLSFTVPQCIKVPTRAGASSGSGSSRKYRPRNCVRCSRPYLKKRKVTRPRPTSGRTAPRPIAMARRRRAASRSALASSARRPSSSSTASTRGPSFCRRVGYRLARKELADLDERVRREVVDLEPHDAVRLDRHRAPERPVRPGPDLFAGDAGRRRDRRPQAVGRHAPARPDQLPVQLAGVVPALRGAEGAVLDAEPRRRVLQAEEDLDERDRALVGHRVRAGRARGGVVRQGQGALRAAGPEHLDPLAARLVELPVDAREVAVERQRAPLAHEKRAVLLDLRLDLDVGDRVVLGLRGGRRESAARHASTRARQATTRATDGTTPRP